MPVRGPRRWNAPCLCLHCILAIDSINAPCGRHAVHLRVLPTFFEALSLSSEPRIERRSHFVTPRSSRRQNGSSDRQGTTRCKNRAGRETSVRQHGAPRKNRSRSSAKFTHRVDLDRAEHDLGVVPRGLAAAGPVVVPQGELVHLSRLRLRAIVRWWLSKRAAAAAAAAAAVATTTFGH